MQLDLSKPLPQPKLGQLVGLSRRSVADLEADGVCSRDMPAGAWLLAYIEHLRESAAGRDASGELSEERARLARAQAIRVERQNAITARETLPVRVLELALGQTCAQIAATLEGLPGRLKRRCPHWKPADFRLLEEEIAKARNTAAAATLTDEDVDGLVGTETRD